MTPCGNDGADPTTTAVRSVTASAIAARSALKSPSTATRTSGMSKNLAALSNAACAVTGATISGSAIPRRSRAKSRYAFMASRMLSVPPELTAPTTGPACPACPAPSMCAVIETISASNLVALGHRSGCSGLLCDCAAYTRLRKATCAGSPW